MFFYLCDVSVLSLQPAIGALIRSSWASYSRASSPRRNEPWSGEARSHLPLAHNWKAFYHLQTLTLSIESSVSCILLTEIFFFCALRLLEGELYNGRLVKAPAIPAGHSGQWV